VLREVLKLSRSTIPMNIDIAHDFQQDCGLVMADPTQIHQIGMNLVTNAFHAVEEIDGGRITVQVREVLLDLEEKGGITNGPGKYALLAVSDNGIGIPEANLPRIFDPYFTTKPQGKGTGLGLAVVYGIVREHRGEIRVRSTPGKGTKMEVFLPLLPADGSVPRDKDETAVPRGTERILLIDDELPIVRLEKQILERLGYKISERTGSADALEAFRRDPGAWDLVITDMSMPNMTGERLAREMLALRPDLPVILCTGFSEKMNADIAARMGIRGLLMKPVVRSELAREVRRVLDERRRQD
jgi:CheY-like chemotaxis protein